MPPLSFPLWGRAGWGAQAALSSSRSRQRSSQRVRRRSSSCNSAILPGYWPAVAAIDIWKTTPFIALLLLAGLQLIPGDVYEAADVDGAGKIRTFFSITLPLLMPSILVAVVIRALDALRVFDLFYVLFGQRPDTTTMSIYVQEQIIYFGKVGYGSAVSVALLFIIAIFIAIYILMSRWSTARS